MTAAGDAIDIPPGVTPRTSGWRAAFAALAGSVTVGFLPIMARRLYDDGMSPYSLLFWRYGIALVVLLLVAGLARVDFRPAWSRGGVRIILIGATLGSAQTLCFFESLRWLETSIAVLLFYTYPAITLVLERILFRRPVQPIVALCVVIILAGAGLIAGQGLHDLSIDPRGLLWAVPGTVIYAIYLAANARLMGRHPPLIGASLLYMGFAASFLGVVLIRGLEWPATPAGWQALLFISLGAGALTVTLFSYSVPRLGPTSYGIIANVELVTVVLLGILALGERLTAGRAAGGALIISGIALHSLFRARRPRLRRL